MKPAPSTRISSSSLTQKKIKKSKPFATFAFHSRQQVRVHESKCLYSMIYSRAPAPSDSFTTEFTRFTTDFAHFTTEFTHCHNDFITQFTTNVTTTLATELHHLRPSGRFANFTTHFNHFTTNFTTGSRHLCPSQPSPSIVEYE
jgi:hypothetical protein